MKKNVLIALFSLMLAACGDETSQQKTAEPTAGKAAAENVLHIYNWNNSLSPETLARFEASCSCKVVQDFYGDNEEMLAKLTAGAKGYDMVFPSAFAVNTLIKQGKLQSLDKKVVANFNNIDPFYLKTIADFDPNNLHAAPTTINLVSLGYNETELKKLGLLESANSWALVFDPALLQKIKGKVTVLDSQRELMAAALLYLGKDANSTDKADLEAAAAVIIKAKPYWAGFNNQSYIKELAVGNIWLALGYSGDFYQAQQDALASKRDFAIGYQIQKEGNSLNMDNMTILKDAPRPDLANLFVNFMLELKNAADFSNNIGATNPVTKSNEFFRPEIKANKIINLDPMSGKFPVLRDLDTKSRREYSQIWSKVKVAN
jgi:putative spermidine/putrescine transport system substrate-binding protein/spermidine/putrescine transport system substrate-binding protein